MNDTNDSLWRMLESRDSSINYLLKKQTDILIDLQEKHLELENLYSWNRKARDQLQEKEAALAQLTQSLEEKEAALAQLTQSLEEKEAALVRLTHSLEEKEAALVRLTQSLQEKEAVIQELGRALEACRSTEPSPDKGHVK